MQVQIHEEEGRIITELGVPPMSGFSAGCGFGFLRRITIRRAATTAATTAEKTTRATTDIMASFTSSPICK
jgi:hypothetical protein